MKTGDCCLIAGLALCGAFRSTAATYYVDISNSVPAFPFTSWATAATNIQDAVDAADAGGLVLVTDGIYQTGGKVAYGVMTNRLAVMKPLTVQSVNGPTVTTILGFQVPDWTNGDGAIRCAYLADGAMLSGFTLSRGATWTYGDEIQDQCGGGVLCASAGATVTNCVLSGNSAYYGAGAYDGALNNCVLSGNWAYIGGGACASVLNNCTLNANSAHNLGGGAYDSTLNNCAVNNNSAGSYGGGEYSCELNNCTLSGNSALIGGGAFGGVLNNCVVYYNSGAQGPNWHEATLNHCCTSPLPLSGTGNLAAEPQLASASHLSAGSPCRMAGSLTLVSGVDIDGENWLSSPAIGCDEYVPGLLTGTLSVAVAASYTNVATGFGVELQGVISGRVSASHWDFGDGAAVSNRPYASHSWAEAGDYTVVLRALNESNPSGVAATTVVHVVQQPVHYVNLNSASPAPPYATWKTAARTIQDAVDSATVAGALVLASNGVYQTGGRIVYVYAPMSNRVAVTKPLTVQSLNGPVVTTIRGFQVPSTGNGNKAIRCAYLADGAVLSGFTLTSGATETVGEVNGGGIRCASVCATVTNCVLTGNSAEGSGGGACGGTFVNCTFGDNAADSGGGACNAILNNCTLYGNSAQAGGGTSDSTLNDCTLSGNWASGGGAALESTLNRCVLSGNLAEYFGGGVYHGTLSNCTLTNNSAGQYGGGAYFAALVNCTVSANSAQSFRGGGAYGGTLNNCTLTGNSAVSGGGASLCVLNNCIVYYNSASQGPNWHKATLNYCCTTPLPMDGIGNLATDPQMVSLCHLSAASSCRGAGSAACMSGADVDGEKWLMPPAIGCDEYYDGSSTGVVSVAVKASYPTVATGFEVEFQGDISGHVSASRWEFGDGTVVSNRPYASHAWRNAGDYQVVLRAFGESCPSGAIATALVHVVELPVHYVSLSSVSPRAPYSTWATAANRIQDAVDAATVVGATVVVSNGVYQTGGRVLYDSAPMSNRVAVTKPLQVRSINGPAVTIILGRQMPGRINGDNSVRCVYLADSAVLSGFTLTNGATRATADKNGGGVRCASPRAVVTNCVLSGNSAYTHGGGAYCGSLCNCVLNDNSALSYGGGACDAILDNCVVTANRALRGGGTYGGTLDNCLLSGNSASDGGGTCSGLLNSSTLSANSAESRGGGACESTLINSIIYYNSANSGSNYDGSELRYCCAAPLASGSGNITGPPLFVDLPHNDLRLEENSPCINAGNNTYAPGRVDLDGRPRITGGAVDLGAYEFGLGPTAPPEFPSCRWASNAMELELRSEVGCTVELYTSTNLTTWVLLATVTNQSGRLLYTDSTATNRPSRFYRAVRLP